jgi:hypothetical protein
VDPARTEFDKACTQNLLQVQLFFKSMPIRLHDECWDHQSDLADLCSLLYVIAILLQRADGPALFGTELYIDNEMKAIPDGTSLASIRPIVAKHALDTAFHSTMVTLQSNQGDEKFILSIIEHLEDLKIKTHNLLLKSTAFPDQVQEQPDELDEINWDED